MKILCILFRFDYFTIEYTRKSYQTFFQLYLCKIMKSIDFRSLCSFELFIHARITLCAILQLSKKSQATQENER